MANNQNLNALARQSVEAVGSYIASDIEGQAEEILFSSYTRLIGRTIASTL